MPRLMKNINNQGKIIKWLCWGENCFRYSRSLFLGKTNISHCRINTAIQDTLCKSGFPSSASSSILTNKDSAKFTDSLIINACIITENNKDNYSQKPKHLSGPGLKASELLTISAVPELRYSSL